MYIKPGLAGRDLGALLQVRRDAWVAAVAAVAAAAGRPAPERPAIKIEAFLLSTIVLNVNTGCNLSCSYCYKEDLDTPAAGRRMAFETAVKSISAGSTGMLLPRKNSKIGGQSMHWLPHQWPAPARS